MLAWLKALSLGKKIALGATTLVATTAIAAPTPPPAEQPVQLDTTQSQQQTVEPKVETKTVTGTKVIAFKTVTQNDSSLDKGKVLAATTGVNGERTITYEITYTDGVETSRKVLSDTVTKEPVNAVTKVGTKEALNCPNGTYVNTYGNTVCRPYESNSVPAGATAKCRDGTYSFSQSRRGTCSHHGGVAVWY